MPESQEELAKAQENFSRKYQALSDDIKAFFEAQGEDLAQTVAGKATYQAITRLEESHMWLINGVGAMAMAAQAGTAAMEAKAAELEVVK